jgi:hypothetical protein
VFYATTNAPRGDDDFRVIHWPGMPSEETIGTLNRP